MISFLNKGLILASPNHIWAGLSTVQELAKLSDIPEMSDIPNVIDNLYSTPDTDALSANQCKVLKDIIDGMGSSRSELGSYIGTGKAGSAYKNLYHSALNHSLCSYTVSDLLCMEIAPYFSRILQYIIG